LNIPKENAKTILKNIFKIAETARVFKDELFYQFVCLRIYGWTKIILAHSLVD